MSNIHLTDELLMAFADGELDDAVANAVAQAIAHDPSAGRQIADYVRSRQIVRSALSTPEQMMVSPALLAAVTKRIAAAEAYPGPSQDNRGRAAQTPPYRRRPPPWLSLAASVAAVVIGLGGFAAGRYASGTYEGGLDILAHVSSPEVERLLGKLPSGRDEALTFGQLRVVATYRTAGGLCREFTVQEATSKADAIACRSGREWNVVLAVKEPEDASYTPAGGDELVSSYLQKIDAGEPLAPSAEETLLAR